MTTDTIYYKVIGDDFFGKKYTLGINTVDCKFEPCLYSEKHCLHYSTFDQICDIIVNPLYCHNNNKFAILQLCKDSFRDAFCIQYGKTNKFNIIEFYSEKDFITMHAMKLVMKNGKNLKCIKNQTFELCVAAVRQDYSALQYVKNQTHKLCMIAVQLNPYVLHHVKTQTLEMCMTAVRDNGGILYYVAKQTHELCMAAVKNDGLALQFVKVQTLKLCIAAVQQNRESLKFADREYITMCYHIVQKNEIRTE